MVGSALRFELPLALNEETLFLMLKNRVFYFVLHSCPGSGPDREIVTPWSFEVVRSKGHEGPSQNRTTKKPHHSIQLWAMDEAGGESRRNLPVKILHGGNGETSPPAFAAPCLPGISRSLFVFFFERDPHGLSQKHSISKG
jgi:hypothetical protein